MATTISTTVPAGWDEEAVRDWLRGRREDAAARAAHMAQASAWREPELAMQAAYYRYELRDLSGAVQLLERQAKATPRNFEVLFNLGVMYCDGAQWQKAAQWYERAAGIEPDRFEVHDGFADCLWRLGRFDETIAAGTRALEIKDALTRNVEALALPGTSPAEFCAGKASVISYSLWGGKPRYLRGMLRNVLLAPDVYPGWTVRIHLDDTVPAEFIALVGKLGAQVVHYPAGARARDKLAWRFRVANDKHVGRFLVRDADAVIGVREAQAVQAWIASGRWFHAMRDFWTHTDLVLAGMWGGIAGVLPDIAQALAAYRPPNIELRHVDQWFLRDCVWPHMRQSCLVHDRVYHPAGAEPFPGDVPEGTRHVGQDEYQARRAEQEKLLAAWIAQYPCLAEAQPFT